MESFSEWNNSRLEEEYAKQAELFLKKGFQKTKTIKTTIQQQALVNEGW